MALDFPNSPTTGQQFGNWTWDGTKWVAGNLAMPQLKMNVQVFTASGTYTPTPGTQWAVVECIGGGGGGGWCGNQTAALAGGGGGSGGYSRSVLSAATIGGSQSVTIGAGGGSTNNGGATSFGSLVIAQGGVGGRPDDGTNTNVGSGGSAAPTGTGQVAVAGNAGMPGATKGSEASFICANGGTGGASILCGTNSQNTAQNTTKINGSNGQFGAGGNGAAQVNAPAPGPNGGTGGNGICIVTEFGF